MNPISALVWIGLMAAALSGVQTAVELPAASTREPSFKLRTERFGMPAVSMGASVYVAGGHSDRGLCKDIERLAPAEGAVSVVSAPILPRYFHNGAGHEGRLYLLGGVLFGGEAAAKFEEVDPETGTVTELPPMPQPVTRMGVVVHEHRLYVIGGEKLGGVRAGDVQIYDFRQQTWSTGAEMPVAREGMVALGDGKVYVPGGYNGREAVKDFQVYDIAADSWEQLPDLPIKMSAHSGVIVGDLMYTFGDYEVLNRTAVCDLKTGEWSLIDVGYRSSRHNAAVLHGDEVLVIGGNVAPHGPFLDYIQRFSIKKLAAAPRRPWTLENEPKPEPLPASARAACGAAPSSATPRGPEPAAFELSGKAASDFELELLDGSTFRLADHKGRVVVLDFWATWCPPCRKALPHMTALAEEYKDKDVVFLGVSRDRPGDEEKVAKMLADNKVPYPAGIADRELASDYAVSGIPCVVLIGRDGRIQGRQVGFWDQGPEALRKALDQLLAGEDLPSAQPPPPSARPAERASARESSRPDSRFFRPKWRRDIGISEEVRPIGQVLELRIPPRRLAVTVRNAVQVLNASDGELLLSVPLPVEALRKDEMDRLPFLVYLQDGSSGTLVVVRNTYEVTEREGARRSYRSKGAAIMGLSETGETIWTNSPGKIDTMVHAETLPVAEHRDALLLASWNRLLLFNGRGEILLDQPLVFRDQWTIWPGADGKLEVVIRGKDVAGYEWNPLAGD